MDHQRLLFHMLLGYLIVRVLLVLVRVFSLLPDAASPLAPEPIRQRLTQRAGALEAIAERHARTRITAEAGDHG